MVSFKREHLPHMEYPLTNHQQKRFPSHVASSTLRVFPGSLSTVDWNKADNFLLSLVFLAFPDSTPEDFHGMHGMQLSYFLGGLTEVEVKERNMDQQATEYQCDFAHNYSTL